ncbi:FtsK/SpoIIIE domain-containing protein [Demequina sp. SYSU T00039]|uniref:FtsK/SpoIIIE domain-containing protein n=1 Tax=Demequina lignilytica TaxID=3051663 RepID=A0AAW7M8Z7_9MICO|nr:MULTISPECIES: FtsK/SpoIIIE domain-containing protein [unclassified Demequina]MDN4478255.1 FtsK/SpoIIIE domain-containing protein [Demequina sp. SYSU T00039-1]MDN4488295.1 FtsK/SpoIIIE domain-containing protein [Demequina sp. SYSU T00039]
MIISVDGVGDLEVEPGTPVSLILAAAGAPAARWCGGARLDPRHRAGRPPLVHAALLTSGPQASPPPDGRPHLAVIAGPDAGLGLAPAARAAVGRSPDAALVIADPAVSRRHAEVDERGRLRDLGSGNGTVLVRRGRRRRVGRRRIALRHDDVISVGASVLAWREPLADAPGPRSSIPHGRSLGSLAGATVGAAAVGVMSGRWWLGALLAAATAASAAVAWARGRPRHAARDRDGLERLGSLPLPLAIVGPRHRAAAAARAVAVVADRAWDREAGERWERWLASDAAPGSLVLVASPDLVPSEAVTVLDLDRGLLTVRGEPRAWTPASMSARTAETLARAARGTGTEPVRDVRWGELAAVTRSGPARARTLRAAIGRDASGDVILDLDADGPHLLVAGTTGSGKSLLLETLVSALAHDHAPEDLALALIDFKGGAGLGPCAGLPHVGGLLTDLEPRLARRALQGLAHELRQRKGALRQAGLPSWHDWEAAGGAPPRLVVVIDEFQELAAADPGFLTQAATLAAQGRSLGMYLVLATQRPAGVVTPQIRANVSAVIALRVSGAAESHDLLGDDAAHRLPADAPGAAVLLTARRRTVFRAAVPVVEPRPPARLVGSPAAPGTALASEAARRWAQHAPATALWLPPASLDTDPLPGSAGWLDLPAERRRAPLVWDPGEGPALVLGPRGARRAAAIAALAASTPGTLALPEDPREAVRTLELAASGAVRAVAVEDAERARQALEDCLRAPGEQALEELARRVPLILGCAPGWPVRWSVRAALRVVLPEVEATERSLWGVPAELQADGAADACSVAIGAGGAAAVALRAAGPWRPATPLVAPLRCGPGLAADALGVRGDEAAPLRLAGEVEVAGPPHPHRSLTVETLRRHGIEPRVAAAPGGAGVVDATIVPAPSPALLRGWGVRVPPGLIDPQPVTGRVLLLTSGGWEAAQLRVETSAPASAARRDHVP